MAETREVFPACPWPTRARLRIFAPSYTFTGSLLFRPRNDSRSRLPSRAQLGIAGFLRHQPPVGLEVEISIPQPGEPAKLPMLTQLKIMAQGCALRGTGRAPLPSLRMPS